MCFSSKSAMKMLAKFGAILVPIATPCTCKKKMSQKVKQLYSKINLSICSISSFGGWYGCLNSSMYFRIIWIDSLVGMLV